MIALLAVLSAALVATPAASAGEPRTVADVLATFSDEPTIAQVQAWADDEARTSPRAVERTLRSVRAAAWLPELDVEYRVRDGWDKGWDYYPTDGNVDTVKDATDVFDVPSDVGADQDRYVTIRASWDLSELVSSPDRLRAVDEAQDLVKLRDKVQSEVTALYFDRRRLQVRMLLDPKPDVRGQAQDALQLEEMTAGIDALTGGRFSSATAHSSG